MYKSLDISKPDSIKSFVSDLKSAGQPVDVLINNAGINLDKNFNYDNATTTVDVNYRGTLHMCQAILPLLAKNGRIVNLSSVGSLLTPYSKEVAQEFRTVSTLEEVDNLMDAYLHHVKNGTQSQGGYPVGGRSYSVSKAGINAFTRVLAKENPGLTINCCCPGWVDTDMGGIVGKAPKSTHDGAVIPVRLALDDIYGVTGRYWSNDDVRSKGPGKPQNW